VTIALAPSVFPAESTDGTCSAARIAKPGTSICASTLSTTPPSAAFFFYRGGISADRLAASMLKNTTECTTIAITSAHAMSSNTFELRVYIMVIPR
jgi:hypothetical protein